jgi:hypothetical protein
MSGFLRISDLAWPRIAGIALGALLPGLVIGVPGAQHSQRLRRRNMRSSMLGWMAHSRVQCQDDCCFLSHLPPAMGLRLT